MTQRQTGIRQVGRASDKPPKRPPIPAQVIMTKAGLTHAYPWRPKR